MTLKSYQSVDKILKCNFMGKNEFLARRPLELDVVRSKKSSRFSALCTEITMSLG